VPYNFKSHSFSKTAAAKLAERGIVVGAIMILVKRITVDFAKGASMRKDINKGTEISIRGFDGEDKVVANLEATFGKKQMATDVAIKLSNLAFPDKEVQASTVLVGAAHKLFAKYPFLKQDDAAHVENISSWSKNLMCRDNEYNGETIKSRVKIVMDNLWECTDDIGHEDILLVKRGAVFEVWTLREFKANSLVLVPETTEIKPRFYTNNRSAIAKNTVDPMSLDKRPFVLDGRVRANPSSDSKSKFGLFWVVQRSTEPNDKEVNMDLVYTTCSLKATLHIGEKIITQDWNQDDLPSLPVLMNVKKIPKHTRLVAKEDMELKRLVEQQNKSAMRVKEKSDAQAAEDDVDARAEPVGHATAEPASKKRSFPVAHAVEHVKKAKGKQPK
jgi:hypothetical protein